MHGLKSFLPPYIMAVALKSVNTDIDDEQLHFHISAAFFVANLGIFSRPSLDSQEVTLPDNT